MISGAASFYDNQKLAALSPPRRELARAVAVVAVIHTGMLVLFQFGLPNLSDTKKRADISIEFYAPPPTSGERATADHQVRPPNPVTPQASKPVEQVAPKPVQQQALQGASVVAPVPPQTTVMQSAPAQPAGQPNTGPSNRASQENRAAAATTDADYKAAYLKNPKPHYPVAAVRMGVEGQVVLVAEVLTDGRAGTVEIVRSSGYTMLDQSALDAVKSWRFTPARKDGVITTQRVRIPIDFELKKRIN